MQHASDGLYKDEDGWWPVACTCGEELGTAPDAETACDTLMDHAYETGYDDALDDRSDGLD